MIRINAKDIRKAINESLEEIRQLGGGQQSAPSSVGASSMPIQKDNPMAKSPTARAAFYETDTNGNEELVVRLQWIHNQHAALIDEWNQKYGQIFTAQRNMSAKVEPNEPAPIDLHVVPGQESAFEQAIPNIVSDIAKMNGIKGGFYKQSALSALEKSILGRISEAPSKEDFEKAEERQAMNINSILNLLSQPDFLKKIGFVGGTVVNPSRAVSDKSSIIKQGKACGWRISPYNQLMVLSYLPNATFVTNEWTWNNVFNRDVVDKTLFALERKTANDKKVDKNAWNQACAMLGYQDTNNPNAQPYDVYKSEKKRGNLSQSEIMAVAFLANMLNPQSANFTTQKVYDISNTQLRQGMPDVFNDEVGYADNIKGTPNAKAVAADKQTAIDTGVQYVPQQTVRKSDSEITDIINILSAICVRDCGHTERVNGGSLGDAIAKLGECYAKDFICRRNNISIPKIKDAVGYAFATGLAAVFGFQVQKYGSELSSALSNGNHDTSVKGLLTKFYQDFAELVGEINVELLKLSRSRIKANKANGLKQALEESINEMKYKPISFEEFAKLFNDGEMMNNVSELEEEEMAEENPAENLQESFFALMDKMERING